MKSETNVGIANLSTSANIGRTERLLGSYHKIVLVWKHYIKPIFHKTIPNNICPQIFGEGAHYGCLPVSTVKSETICWDIKSLNLANIGRRSDPNIRKRPWSFCLSFKLNTQLNLDDVGRINKDGGYVGYAAVSTMKGENYMLG